MEEVLKGGVSALFIFIYLLPGFLGAVFYDYLTERKRKENFDRIIDAFALTLISSLIVHGLLNVQLVPKLALSKETSIADTLDGLLSKGVFYTSACAVLISVGMAILNNHGWIYAILRRLRLTYKTSVDDVWQDLFYKHRGYWMRVHFADGRSVVGWPKYYSATGKPRELFVADATWWIPNDAGTLTSEDVAGPGVYIADFSKVTSIELLD